RQKGAKRWRDLLPDAPIQLGLDVRVERVQGESRDRLLPGRRERGGVRSHADPPGAEAARIDVVPGPQILDRPEDVEPLADPERRAVPGALTVSAEVEQEERVTGAIESHRGVQEDR